MEVIYYLMLNTGRGFFGFGIFDPAGNLSHCSVLSSLIFLGMDESTNFQLAREVLEPCKGILFRSLW